MRNLVQAVADKIQTLPIPRVDEGAEFALSTEEREALIDAEKLADLYADIKPKQIKVSGGHLFTYPNSE